MISRTPRSGPGAPSICALDTGLACARGEVLALTDDDCVPASDGLARIVSHFRKRPVTFVFGKVLPRRPRRRRSG